MFNPITASQEIKDAFTDYITTTFDFADPDYADELKKSIQESGAVAKGPYLEVSGSYESGESIAELIAEHKVSPLFDTLENCAEKDKELKIQRGLYLHQIAALEKANARKNLVVTTGTGSGKTECFLIPVIDSLLKEEEAGTLNDAVRAIIIYPMNALANDQIKRLQKLLKDHPTIRFGLYNGNTGQTKDRALAEYQRVNGRNAHPLPNEVICRDEMQTNPPHILITNYSMLEYMMLRPKDDKVFSGAQLRYIVLDEAHIYKGATGMETSLLMRRLRARISTPGSVQYILTSATLGGYDADDDIIAFASRLCGAPFLRENIIRSKEKQPALKDTWKIPNQLFTEIAENKRVPSEILADYGFTMDAADEDERLFELLLHSPLFGAVRGICSQSGPLSVNELLQKLADRQFTLSKEELVAFINVCTRAEKCKVSLIKARYHFFVRALEGAYITLNTPKQLFLQRKLFTGNGSQQQAVFECAICTDCGRTAIVGKTIGDHLENVKQWDDKAEYYLVKEQGEAHIFDEDDDEKAVTIDDETGCAENDYVICPICGAISGEADAKLEAPCDHAASNYIKLSKVTVKNTKQIKCSACGFGHLRRFYLGAEAATSVLGTKLFDILPETEETPIPKENRTSGRGLFAARNTRTTTTTTKHRQFLCFSDSRSEAAFFACYMEKSYQEFLRRRGIWHVIEECKKEGKTFLSVSSFVERLSRYFNANKTFAEWDQPENQDIDLACKRNAWIAVLNEMYNARRSTSLASMGLLSFEYDPNTEVCSDIADEFGISDAESKDFLNLLVMDAVYAGAILPDFKLTDADREYIFFAAKQRYMKAIKTAEDSQRSWVMGWAARKRSNGNYYPNARLARVCRVSGRDEDYSNEILLSYWDNVFAKQRNEETTISTKDFSIRLSGDSKLHFYRCKKCGKVTPYYCKEFCSSVKCDGSLEKYDPTIDLQNNHYANLYRDTRMSPLFIKEHSLVVVVRSPEYAVCPVCGYATDDPFPKKHKNPYGYYCKNEEAISKKYILSHDFKTDVAKIVFQTPAASDTNTMLSVLYALLEGMSTALGIERTDIKGTLHKVNWNNRLIYSIILYDAVAGGAGHVRRIVTKDGAAFQNVLHAAYDLVQGCDCDTSCYKCLRNYYNQKIHDQLDRHIAANFIKPWLGVMKPIEEQQQEEATTAECERNSSLDTVLHTDCEYDEDSTSWNEIIENLPLTDSDAEWVSALQKIAERDFLPFPVQSAHITVERSNDELWPDMAWPNLKLALYTSDNTDEYDNWPNCDWKAYKIGDDTLTPEKFAEIIRNTTIR